MVSCIPINSNKNVYKERNKECMPSINIKMSPRSWKNKLATLQVLWPVQHRKEQIKLLSPA